MTQPPVTQPPVTQPPVTQPPVTKLPLRKLPLRKLPLRKLLSTRVAWGVLLTAAIALLVVGSINPPQSAAAARISRLDSIIKCPACEDLSIAQSDAPSSVTLRDEVAAWVHDGWSNARVEEAVVARYGPSGLLLPPASGVDAALYVIPLGAIGLAAVALGWYLWRRQGRRQLAAAETGSS